MPPENLNGVDSANEFPPMPDQKSLLNTLRSHGYVGIAPITDAFFNAFIGEVAGEERDGYGLYSAWTRAMNETLRTQLVVVIASMETCYPRVIELIAPTPSIAAEAITARAEARELEKRV